MMPKNLFVQVTMIAISVGIIFTFVRPTFSDISELQDDIMVYQTEQQKVSEVNIQLSSFMRILNDLAADDQRKLLTYIPNEVDTINVLRDLSLISNEAGVAYISAESVGQKSNTNQQTERSDSDFIQPKEYEFTC
jgi:hypothetical protein